MASLIQGMFYNQKQFKSSNVLVEGMTGNASNIPILQKKLAVIQNNIMGAITNYGNSLNKNDNPYLGQNIQFGPNGPLAYVSERANLKWYSDNDAYYRTNGHNGCPTKIIQITDPKFPAPLNLQLGQLTNSVPILAIGNPMNIGQSCGREGTNVRVTSYINNPTSTLLGCYNSVSQVNGITGNTIPTNMTENLGRVYGNPVNSCKRLAANKGYQYFGLTNTPNSWINTCWATNDLGKAISFGASDDCIVKSDTEYIGDSTNNSMALYQLNEWIYRENMGKIGYVDDDSNVSEYPTSMITYTYTQHDGRGNNLDTLPGQTWIKDITLSDAQTMANSNPNCTQILSVDSNINKPMFLLCSGKSTTFSNIYGRAFTTYIKNVNINSDVSCSKKITNIDSVRWNNYTHTGIPMKSDTKCGISNILYGNDSSSIIEGMKKMKMKMPKSISKAFSEIKKIVSNPINKSISEIKKTVSNPINKSIFDKLPIPNSIKNSPFFKQSINQIIKKQLKKLPPTVAHALNKILYPRKKTTHHKTNAIKQSGSDQSQLQKQLLEESALADKENKKNFRSNSKAMAKAATEASALPLTEDKIDANKAANNAWAVGVTTSPGPIIEKYTNISKSQMNNILQDSYINVNYGIYTYVLWNIIATIILLITIEFLSGRKWSGLRTFVAWIIIIITCNVLFQYYSIPVNILVLIFYILYRKINKV